MADLVGVGAEQNSVRSEVLRQVADAMRRRLPEADMAQAEKFLREYAGAMMAEAISERPAEEMAGAALSLWSFMQKREEGGAKVRVFNPQSSGEGWGSAFAVVEIVNDDMPFLVESALGVLQSFEQPVQALAHPVLTVRRDAAGRLLAIGPDAEGGGAKESVMQIAFGPEAGSAVLSRIAQAIEEAMADVRIAVGDFEAMRSVLISVMQTLPAGPEREFLDWVAQDNFVLLGTREIAFGPDGAVAARTAGDSLGVLRAPDRLLFEVLRDKASWRAIAAQALERFGEVGITKADIRSRVHRPQLYDVIVVKRRNEAGAVTGLTLIGGLFAAEAYNRNPRSIPMLREKVETILREAGVDPVAHDGRALRNVLDTWPRDDLFQGTNAEILAAARRVMQLQVRPELALFLRHDLLSRHISAILFVPRDRFDTALRHRLVEMMNRAVGGELAGYAVTLADGPLARGHFIIAADPAEARKLDVGALEAAMAEATRSFRERLAEALVAEHGEVRAAALLADWRDGFPADYSADTPATIAVQDIALAEAAFSAGGFTLALNRPFGMAGERLVLKLFHAGEPIALSDIVPLIESLGLRVIEELPYPLTPRGRKIVLQELTLETADRAALDLGSRGTAITEAISAAWTGRCEIDGFNRLVVRAGLEWREAWLLRAMFKWCRQVRAPSSQAAVENALSANPEVVRNLVGLFRTRFDPTRAHDETAETVLADDFFVLLDRVENPDEDRILRRLRTLLDAVLRTNFFDTASPVIALKIDSARAGAMPLPRPMVEIYVHGARMEGCHLRGGKVARGGIRWSDRRDDFRTEILGLMKAQMVKNVVIVPVGAKGGFVLKRPPAPSGNANADREALAAEGIACYKQLINAMLDVTDTLRGGVVVPPPGIVRRDKDDPYLVVAADKGTASFSDIANAIAIERGFWLGDAFASGGSVGYDHKAMGITARGAWVNIARHFHELGHDIQREDFSCAGVGDMSGDVFGNGLLISRHTRLLAAFDHRHIFLDPDPDPAASYEERKRLFALPRSSWADYDAGKISAGGAVLPRTAKRVTLSEQAAAMLGLAAGRHEPAEVIRAILTMHVDLLYFGGIGTYVKSGSETDDEVGDRANDAIRVDGRAVRARVIGEGANLAVTQSGRIEAALAGVKINTDALDNSAGVSTSDHEVNIKIMLGDAMEKGRLTARQRVELLESMTDTVAELVLRDNHQQSLAISLDALGDVEDLPAQNALMLVLEAAGILDRAVAGLPDTMTMGSRAAAGQALTRPELCTLMAHAKLHLAAVIDASPLLDDPALIAALIEYFPRPLQERFETEIGRHRLRRELIGAAVTNELLNRMGAASFGRLIGESGADLDEIAHAALIARAAFDLPSLYTTVEELTEVPASAELAVLMAARRLQETGTRIFLAGGGRLGPIAAESSALRPGLSVLMEAAIDRARDNAAAQALVAQGVPERLAGFVAALGELQAAPLIVRLAALRGETIEAAKAAWDETGTCCAIDTLRAALGQIAATGNWGARAIAALGDELGALQAEIAGNALAGSKSPSELIAETGRPATRAIALAREAAAAPDLAALTVAVRGLWHGLVS